MVQGKGGVDSQGSFEVAFIQSTLERWYLGIVALVGLLAGIVFGLLAAATGGFDFVAGWLVVAYVLVAAFFVNAFLIGEKVVRVGKAAIEAEAERRPADQAFGDLPANRGVILVLVNVVIFAAIIADMVLKPFSRRLATAGPARVCRCGRRLLDHHL